MSDPRKYGEHNESDGSGPAPTSIRGIDVSGGDAYVQKMHPHASERAYENSESGLVEPDSIAYPG